MSMATVDTMMVGRFPTGATAMGAVSIGSNIFIVLALFGGGLLMGLDTLVSQAFGAGKREDCHRSLLNSIYLSIALTPFLTAAVWLLPSLLGGMHVDPGVLALAIPYTKALPAAIQFTLESGVFALITALIARLGAVPLASHQIALTPVAFTSMVPLGIASAAAVRVVQAIGRGAPRGAGEAGGTAIFLGAAFMTCASAALLLFPRWIARMYTPDETVIHSTILLLAAGAAFQLFDGIQTVATGALRGAGDTRTPMFCHFTAYWIIGVRVSPCLCFRRGLR